MPPNKNRRFTRDVFKNRILDRNGILGEDACSIMAAAIEAVDPYVCVNSYIKLSDQNVYFGNQVIEVDRFKRVILIGFGKASVPMANALIDIFGEKISYAAVITKDKRFLVDEDYQRKLQIHLGGHPIPTGESIAATVAILDRLQDLTENDLVLVVISGGGSALFMNPIARVTLNDFQVMTEALLKSGADIHEINTLRKHLDLVKGGRLAMMLKPACVHTFILSDVIGDRLDMIASGPTVPDPTTYREALDIIEKYDLESKVPQSILKILEKGSNGDLPETLKEGEFSEKRVHNHLVGTNIKAAEAAKQQADYLGYHSLIISSHLTGDTKDVAKFLDGIIQTELWHGHPARRPACLIIGGETTVEVKGEGLGGRNQDLVLRMVRRISGKPGILVVSLATDGEDGPTDAAGAACDGLVLGDGTEKLGLNIDTYIENNNSYVYLDELGCLIKTGSTGTNVNDLVIILVDQQRQD